MVWKLIHSVNEKLKHNMVEIALVFLGQFQAVHKIVCKEDSSLNVNVRLFIGYYAVHVRVRPT